MNHQDRRYVSSCVVQEFEDDVDAMLAERKEKVKSKIAGWAMIILVFLLILAISQCSTIVNNP